MAAVVADERELLERDLVLVKHGLVCGVEVALVEGPGERQRVNRRESVERFAAPRSVSHIRIEQSFEPPPEASRPALLGCQASALTAAVC